MGKKKDKPGQKGVKAKYLQKDVQRTSQGWEGWSGREITSSSRKIWVMEPVIG